MATRSAMPRLQSLAPSALSSDPLQLLPSSGSKMFGKPSPLSGAGMPLKPAGASLSSEPPAPAKRPPMKLASMVTDLDAPAPAALKPLPAANPRPLKLASMASMDFSDALPGPKSSLDAPAPMKPLGMPGMQNRGRLPLPYASGPLARKPLMPDSASQVVVVENKDPVSRAKLGGPLRGKPLGAPLVSKASLPDPLADAPFEVVEVKAGSYIHTKVRSLGSSDEFPSSDSGDSVSNTSSDGSGSRSSRSSVPLPPLGKAPPPSPRTARIMRNSMTSETVRGAAGKQLITGRSLLKTQSA